MRNREREIRRMVESSGLQCLELSTTGGNHYAVRAQLKCGTTKKIVFSNTPGDFRGDKNRLAQLRRFAAGTESVR